MKILFLIILSCYAAITGANEVTTSTPEAIDSEVTVSSSAASDEERSLSEAVIIHFILSAELKKKRDFQWMAEKQSLFKEIYEGSLSQFTSDERKRQIAKEMANALTPLQEDEIPAESIHAICITTDNNDLLELCSSPYAKDAILEVIQKRIVNNEASVEDIRYLQRAVLSNLYNIQVYKEKYRGHLIPSPTSIIEAPDLSMEMELEQERRREE